MHPTLDQLHQLGLAGMARAFAELEANPASTALSHAEWLALLLDREATERYERRLRAQLLDLAMEMAGGVSTELTKPLRRIPASLRLPLAISAASRKYR